MSDCPSAPKADALPGCATPRTAEALRFPADPAQAESDVRGNVRQNRAGTCSKSPGKSQNHTFAGKTGDRVMETEDRRDLARLIASQCNAIQQDIMNRALTGREFTDAAINDTRRILSHLVRSIDERAPIQEQQPAGQENV